MLFRKFRLSLSIIFLMTLTDCGTAGYNLGTKDFIELSEFKGEGEGIEIYFKHRSRLGSLLPGDRFDLYFLNTTSKPFKLNIESDKYYYYSANMVYEAHIFVSGLRYPDYVAPKDTVKLGILTDIKGLTIDAFEARFDEGRLRIVASKIRRY